LVKSGDDVQFGVLFSFGDISEGFRNQKKRITIFDDDFIKSSVVDTETNASARLMCQ
jgi:hypothetical protein